VRHQTALDQARERLAIIATVAAGHLEQMDADYGETVCTRCAERLVGPDWPTVALAWADYMRLEHEA
jgi:hypothetical protein